MILYTEEQLEIAYTEYRKLHMRNNVPFLKKEDFRILFEYFMENITLEYV
tara:strand:+ start:1387 stop:1536 length:150 start_codon:yes stop_codon:yes gene_type:complete